MNRLIKELYAYFEAKENPTADEQHFLKSLKNNINFFPVSYVSREDLTMRGFKGDVITDEQMENLIYNMNESYLVNGYWEDLVACAEHNKFPELGSRRVLVMWNNGKKAPKSLPKLVTIPDDLDENGISTWLNKTFSCGIEGWSFC